MEERALCPGDERARLTLVHKHGRSETKVDGYRQIVICNHTAQLADGLLVRVYEEHLRAVRTETNGGWRRHAQVGAFLFVDRSRDEVAVLERLDEYETFADTARFFDQLSIGMQRRLEAAAGIPEAATEHSLAFTRYGAVETKLAGGVAGPFPIRCGAGQGRILSCPKSALLCELKQRVLAHCVPGEALRSRGGLVRQVVVKQLADDQSIGGTGPHAVVLVPLATEVSYIVSRYFLGVPDNEKKGRCRRLVWQRSGLVES
jgi:hypothetical protein